MLYLAQALAGRNVSRPLQWEVITSGVQEVNGQETLSPEQAPVLGLCKVIAQEYRHITCRTIDVMIPQAKVRCQKQIKQLVAELRSTPVDRVVAYREEIRWVQTFNPFRQTGAAGIPLRADCVPPACI